MDDRRRFKRLPTAMVAHLATRRATQTETLQMQIRNLSTGGVFIVTPHPYAPGSLVEFDFALPEGPGPIHAKGVVRWVEPSGPQPGMGVEFIEVSTDSRRELTDFIRKKSGEKQTGIENAEPEG